MEILTKGDSLTDQKHRHARLKRKVQRRGSLFSHRDEACLCGDDRECVWGGGGDPISAASTTSQLPHKHVVSTAL